MKASNLERTGWTDGPKSKQSMADIRSSETGLVHKQMDQQAGKIQDGFGGRIYTVLGANIILELNTSGFDSFNGQA
jgi:hypothetical protein